MKIHLENDMQYQMPGSFEIGAFNMMNMKQSPEEMNGMLGMEIIKYEVFMKRPENKFEPDTIQLVRTQIPLLLLPSHLNSKM